MTDRRARTLDGVVGYGGDAASSLLEKYTFLETVRTVVEEEHLPELGDFLEQIGLANRLEVCKQNLKRPVRRTRERLGIAFFRCWGA